MPKTYTLGVWTSVCDNRYKMPLSDPHQLLYPSDILIVRLQMHISIECGSKTTPHHSHPVKLSYTTALSKSQESATPPFTL